MTEQQQPSTQQELTNSISSYGHPEHIKYLDSKNLAASTKSTNIPKKTFEIRSTALAISEVQHSGHPQKVLL